MKLLLRPIFLIAALFMVHTAMAQSVEFTEPAKPAKTKVSGVTVGEPPSVSGPVQVPMITWGGDAATLLANGGKDTVPASAFGQANLDVRLYKQDDAVAQVRDYMEGKTPFIRGTMGMINTYLEALNADPRTKPVVVLQLTWSTGGDCLVVRGDDIKKAADLKGKTILLQQYGPHVEYMDKVLTDAGLSWSDVTVKWCEELFDLDGKPNDPASIMRVDPSIDAVFCISPDAAALTSNMTVGTGAEDSVEGARVLLSTKTASRIIADVYAVRSDFLEANRTWVENFVKAHLDTQKKLVEMMKNRESEEYRDFIRMSADALLDDPEAAADMEGLLADCTFVLPEGNATYFQAEGNLAGFAATVSRNQAWLVTQGFVTAQQSLAHAEWDFASQGIAAMATPDVKFKEDKAREAVQDVSDTGILFEFEINFEPNQSEFDEAQYGQQFQRALELASTYSGALLEIVGHSDPTKYMRMKDQGLSEAVMQRQTQAGVNLSTKRADTVRDSVLAYAGKRKILVNETQFITTGRGYDDPKVGNPSSADDMAANRRVQFRIINIEGELEEVTF